MRSVLYSAYQVLDFSHLRAKGVGYALVTNLR
jgi:hypothetical protein